jgi:hypothetical protein
MSLSPKVKNGTLVKVTAPAAGHHHMRGARGQIGKTYVDKNTKRWTAKVLFLGGVGTFELDELEAVNA